MSGYAHAEYAGSLAEFGRPYELPGCKGWILQRQIPGEPHFDAMGCYPLFACDNWSKLYLDLENIAAELVSITLVTDPFGEYDITYLRHCFKDIVFPFKEHFIVDLNCSPKKFVSTHHLRYSKRALQNVRVESCRHPTDFTGEWIALYNTLIKKHNIKGIPAFSEKALAQQLKIPGIEMFRAMHNGTTVGITLWYTKGNVGYYHLGAYSAFGYKLRASFALFRFAIEYFAQTQLQWLNLGGGAGIKDDNTDGLSRFKRGWSTGTRSAYFCGRIFNPTWYWEIARKKGVSETHYFPAYRVGEFK